MWEMPEVKPIALPPEYNIRTMRSLIFRTRNESLPRLIHWPFFKTKDSFRLRLWKTFRTLRFSPRNIWVAWRSLKW
jgi:hypothetical protein